MAVTLDPNLAQFLEEQVQAGRFATTTEALEAGIARLMLDPEADTLDPQDLADIKESLERMKRGEVLTAAQVRARLQSRIANP